MFQQLINPIKLETVSNFDICLLTFCRSEYFANSFFPYTIKEWNNLSPEIRKSVLLEVLKNS